jgi:hypothetical protein
MRITDVMTEQQISELGGAPAGLMSQGWNKTMGALGSKTAQAATDVGTRSNEIYNSFRDWALRSGVDMKATPVPTIKKWLTSQNLPGKIPPELATAGILDLTDQRISTQLWKAVAQGAYGSAMSGGRPQGTPSLGNRYGTSTPAPTGSGGSSQNFSSIAAALQTLNLTASQKAN